MIRRKNQLDRFLKWLKEKRPTIKTAEQITGPIAAGFAAHLADDGLKTKTRANILGELGCIWRMLEKASTDIKNPWGNLAPRNTDSERGLAFSPEQEKRLLEAAKRIGKDWYPVCILMRHTGLRYSDVARLRWSDINNGIIETIPHKTATSKISVMIPLVDVAKAAIDALERRGDFLFPLHAELYGNRSRASREVLSFREVMTASGIAGKGYTIHSWRHTAATRLAEAGADMETRKRILGHRTDEMAAHYDHAAHLEQTRAALNAAAQ
jgi:integrase